jgi:hypothetical protein
MRDRPILLLILVLFAAFLVAQAVRPSLGKPAGPQKAIAAPPEVQAIFKRRCEACHSDSPRLAWFDQLAPAYWLVARDVRNARTHLNFSELGSKPPALQRAALFEAVNQVQLGAMPLPSYRAVHRGAEMTPEELNTVKTWLAPFAPAPVSAQTPAKPGDNGAMTAMRGQASGQPAGPSPNGVPFPADYKSWQLISTTDRGDNHTLRLITGNPTAIKAIAEHRTDPWPDGATFAKIAIQAVDDGKGHIASGQFTQVEFMEKDAAKYKETQGWGYARWRGNDLKPYGKGAHFDTECTGCHQPMRDNDYVYTLPMPRTGAGQ